MRRVGKIIEREREGRTGKRRKGKGWGREGKRGEEREGRERRICDAMRGINWYSYSKSREKEMKGSKQTEKDMVEAEEK